MRKLLNRKWLLKLPQCHYVWYFLLSSPRSREGNANMSARADKTRGSCDGKGGLEKTPAGKQDRRKTSKSDALNNFHRMKVNG